MSTSPIDDALTLVDLIIERIPGSEDELAIGADGRILIEPRILGILVDAAELGTDNG